MLSRQHRLSRRDLNHLKLEGKTLRTPHFTLLYSKHPEHFRAAIIITKKTLPRAVDRNRLRRQLFASLSTHLSQLPSLDLLIILHLSAPTLPSDELKHHLLNQIPRLSP